MTNQDLPNQSQFSAQESMIAERSQHSLEETAQPSEEETNQSNAAKRRQQLIIGVVALLALIILGLALLVWMSSGASPKESNLDDTNLVQTLPPEAGPLQVRVNNLKTQLMQADPAKNDLALPPLDMDLRLDPKQR
jgi:hypothetical protein